MRCTVLRKGKCHCLILKLLWHFYKGIIFNGKKKYNISLMFFKEHLIVEHPNNDFYYNKDVYHEKSIL